ncbi:MAG: threonyl-tRNA synthetase editing domain-containing protein [Melioribacteraceae bacterium]|nr:threonyl-tRNA synthetase editing domain-containing protein [Melioribacteraceae bacterium]
MKLLIFYTNKFSFETNQKGLESVEDINVKDTIQSAVIGFIHVESQDEENESYVRTKLVKNLKWAARKNGTDRIVLHSFNHLSTSNASVEFTQALFNNVEERLNNSDYQTSQTPFGYFLNLEMVAPGTPLARIFKEF